VSDLSIAITTGAFTLAAGVLGILGTGFIQWQAWKRDQRAVRGRLVSEALAAAYDLRAKVEATRGDLTGATALPRSDFLKWVLPAQQRLIGTVAAVATLQDERLSEAVNNVSRLGSALVVAGWWQSPENDFPQAEHDFDQSLMELQGALSRSGSRGPRSPAIGQS
jgi:hypothetical protein